MENVRLELSPRILKGRYANFSRESGVAGRIFMLGYEECAPDYLIERSSFPFWTLEFIVGGHGDYGRGTEKRALRHGAVFMYGPGIAQYFMNEPERPFRKYFMACGGDVFPVAWSAAGLSPGQLFQVGSVAPIISVFDRMLDEGSCIDAETPRIIAGLETVLMSLISRHRSRAGGSRPGSRRAFEMAMDLVQREYRSLHSLADLAERTGYSGEYLCRIFRRHHGETPYRVLSHRKMSAAWLLLRDGRMKVGAVAREVGYEDPLHFSRTFRKIMGCPPSSVRRRD